LPYYLSTLEVSTSSDVTSCVIVLLSITALFFITTSSLTYGFFITFGSSLFNNIFISSVDCIGSCTSVSLAPIGDLLSILSISSI